LPYDTLNRATNQDFRPFLGQIPYVEILPLYLIVFLLELLKFLFH